MRLQDFPTNFIEHFLNTNLFAEVDSNGITRAQYIAELARRAAIVPAPAEKPASQYDMPQFKNLYGR